MRVALCLLLLTAATACSNSESAPVEAASGHSGQSGTIGTSPEATSFYSVDVYDPERDASADLTSTIARATKDGKRILLEVGGLW